MASTSYFDRVERKRIALNAHGLSCPPSLTEIAEAICDLDDKLTALAQAEGYVFRKDYRNRWRVFPGRDAS